MLRGTRNLDGSEARQKQVAGGGPYPEGVGWAIGVERLLLALDAKGGD